MGMTAGYDEMYRLLEVIPSSYHMLIAVPLLLLQAAPCLSWCHVFVPVFTSWRLLAGVALTLLVCCTALHTVALFCQGVHGAGPGAPPLHHRDPRHRLLAPLRPPVPRPLLSL